MLLKDDDDEEALETELFTNIGENQVGSGGWGILNMITMMAIIDDSDHSNDQSSEDDDNYYNYDSDNDDDEVWR